MSRHKIIPTICRVGQAIKPVDLFREIADPETEWNLLWCVDRDPSRVVATGCQPLP